MRTAQLTGRAILSFVTVLILTIFVLAPSAKPQGQATSDWDVHMLAGSRAFDAQDFTEAEKQAKLALQFSSRFHPEDMRIERNLRFLGRIYQAQNRFPEAESSFHKALQVHHDRVGSGDDTLPDCYEDLAQLYEAEGKYNEAEPLRQRALKMMTKSYDGKGIWVAQRMESLAAVYVAEQKYAEADALYKKSISLTEEQFGRESARLADPLQKRADVLLQLGRQTEAAALHDRASQLLGKSP